MTTIGILAYGTLIADPGLEIAPAIVDRIRCRTPFKIEFARTSNGPAEPAFPFGSVRSGD